MVRDRCSHDCGVDVFLQLQPGFDHLEILARKELARTRDVDRVARELNAVFRSSQRGGTDALARREQFERKRAAIQTLANRKTEAASQVAEVALLAAVDVFADAAGDHRRHLPYRMQWVG